MTWMIEHVTELVLIGGYLAILAHHATVGNRHVHSLDDYLVAGRRLGGFVIALSFYATFMSTNTFIGAAGKSWDHGLAWCVGGIVLTGLACASWLVVAPRFVPLTREYNSLTVADFLGSHYQSPAVRRIAAAIVAFSSILYLIAIYRGAVLALASFLDLPPNWCIAGVFLIVTAYTLLGGFESVVLTDALQGTLMLVGAVVLLGAMIEAGGGIPTILNDLQAQSPSLVSFTNRDALAAALAYSLAVGIKYLVEPRQLSRFYGLRDQRALRLASIAAPLAIFVTYLCLLPVGAMARTLIPPDSITDTDQVVPYLLGSVDLVGPLFGPMFLLLLASAAMSSIDSVLLVAASTIDRDLIGAGTASNSRKEGVANSLRRARMWVVIVSLTAAGAAWHPAMHDIVQVTKFSGSLYGACFLPTLVVGLFVRRRSPTAAIVTLITGSLTVVTAFVLREQGVTRLEEVYPGIAVGLVVFAALTVGATRFRK